MGGRWSDWAALAAGIATALSWIWHGMFGPAMVALFLLGLATVFTATICVTRPGLVLGEALLAALGVLVFLTPWLIGFAGKPVGAWTAWITGAVIAVMGVVGLPPSRRARRTQEPHGPDGSWTRSPTAHSPVAPV